MNNLLLVFVGGGVGSICRYEVGVLSGRWLRGGPPFGAANATFVVNLVGGLLMGLLVGWLAHRAGANGERWRLLFAVGCLGGFTTFSAFSLDTALMIEKRLYGAAATYVSASVALSVGALFVGLLLSRRLFA